MMAKSMVISRVESLVEVPQQERQSGGLALPGETAVGDRSVGLRGQSPAVPLVESHIGIDQTLLAYDAEIGRAHHLAAFVNRREALEMVRLRHAKREGQIGQTAVFENPLGAADVARGIG